MTRPLGARKSYEQECAASGGPVHTGVAYVAPKTCELCGTLFKAAKNREKYAKYCSAVCAATGQRQARKTVPKKCLSCGDDYLADKYKADTSKYCGHECRLRGINGEPQTVNCVVCGKPQQRNPSKICASPTCSAACRAIWLTKDSPATNNAVSVRKWFSRKGRMSACEACGYSQEPRILVLHHKDRDRRNNELSNLKVLCPNCHALEHLEDRAEWHARSRLVRRKVEGNEVV